MPYPLLSLALECLMRVRYTEFQSTNKEVLGNMRQVTLSSALLGMVFLASASASFGELAQSATVTPASAEQAHQQAPLFTFLQEYFSSLAQGNVDKIAAYHPTLTPQQLDLLHDYFAHTVRDL